MEMYWPFWGRCRGPTALALRRSAILRKKDYQAAQGVIRICPAGPETLETRTLINRYRTIPNIDFGPQIENFHSLNGANFAVSRQTLDIAGPFDERLGLGASGTSEDVEFARRLRQKGF
jgi:GT2 family glycosyltransferase